MAVKPDQKPDLRIVLCSPRGFCAGVVRAIDTVERALAIYGAPVYVRHEIVHNRYVVDSLKTKGAIFVEELAEIPDNTNAPVVFSAHGVPKSVPAEARAAADPGLTSLIEGVELTERSLLNALEKNGVKRFDPMGQKFDPNFQQAMYEVPDPSVPSGTVVQVVQAGYMIGERVLRPALVGVSKGGAKAAPAAANGNEPNNAA